MFLMTLGNIGDLWDAIHDTDLVVIGRPLFSILFFEFKMYYQVAIYSIISNKLGYILEQVSH
jgi:hypothetical protein